MEKTPSPTSSPLTEEAPLPPPPEGVSATPQSLREAAGTPPPPPVALISPASTPSGETSPPKFRQRTTTKTLSAHELEHESYKKQYSYHKSSPNGSRFLVTFFLVLLLIVFLVIVIFLLLH